MLFRSVDSNCWYGLMKVNGDVWEKVNDDIWEMELNERVCEVCDASALLEG